MSMTDVKDLAKTNTPGENDNPIVLRKRIGSTAYLVSVHFSQTSKETLEDKILRLIKNDSELRKAAGE